MGTCLVTLPPFPKEGSGLPLGVNRTREATWGRQEPASTMRSRESSAMPLGAKEQPPKEPTILPPFPNDGSSSPLRSRRASANSQWPLQVVPPTTRRPPAVIAIDSALLTGFSKPMRAVPPWPNDWSSSPVFVKRLTAKSQVKLDVSEQAAPATYTAPSEPTAIADEPRATKDLRPA